MQRPSIPIAIAAIVAIFVLLSHAPSAESQQGGALVDARGPLTADEGELSFVRLEYDSVGGPQEAYYFAYGRLWQRWETDFPEAERNFSRRLTQLSRIAANPRVSSRRLMADDLFRFPFLYLSDVGWMDLEAEEIERFREYLARGGFVWVDDFWGDAEWGNFERVMRQVLPDTVWRELPDAHPIRNMVFEVPEIPQIPARDFAMMGQTTEPDWVHRGPAGNMVGAHLRGYFDSDGRLMVIATHNTDVGDGFEREAYGQWYFETYSTRAYALGVNILVYALTH